MPLGKLCREAGRKFFDLHPYSRFCISWSKKVRWWFRRTHWIFVGAGTRGTNFVPCFLISLLYSRISVIREISLPITKEIHIPVQEVEESSIAVKDETQTESTVWNEWCCFYLRCISKAQRSEDKPMRFWSRCWTANSTSLVNTPANQLYPWFNLRNHWTQLTQLEWSQKVT